MLWRMPRRSRSDGSNHGQREALHTWSRSWTISVLYLLSLSGILRISVCGSGPRVSTSLSLVLSWCVNIMWKSNCLNMKQLPTHSEMKVTLDSYNFDIGKCIDYFIEELGFDGAVVFRDPPWFLLASHYHRSDDYLYILDGELLLEIDWDITRYIRWDFCVVPKGVIHSVKPGNGGKYIVATQDGDFESIFN